MATFYQFNQDPTQALGNLLRARQRTNKTKMGMASPAFKSTVNRLWDRLMDMALYEPERFNFMMARFRYLVDPNSQVPDALDLRQLMSQQAKVS